MPLPLILGGGAILAGLAGVGAGVHGASKMKEANDTMKALQARQETAVEKMKRETDRSNRLMDEVGRTELETMKTFEEFSRLWAKIQNKPEFKTIERGKWNLPEYEPEKLHEVSVGAGVLLGGLGGAAVGTAGGFAAAGATTVAVMALGTASTGTAIGTLSGAALTNATLAALGGGALAAGGGGVALGTTVLGAATLGVGLLVGGVIFNVVGGSISKKADEARAQVEKTEKDVQRIVNYLCELRRYARKFNGALKKIAEVYLIHLRMLDKIVNGEGKTDWNDFTDEEKLTAENAVLLVGMAYKLCQTQLVKTSKKKDELNTVNKEAIDNVVTDVGVFMTQNKLSA